MKLPTDSAARANMSRKRARAILGNLNRFVPENVSRGLALVNGQPGMVSWHGARPFAVFTLDGEQRLIRNIYVITNPDKLADLERGGQPPI